MLLGTLGAGCAPCGATVAAGVLSTTGVATTLAVLPFGGTAVLVVAAGMVVLSMHWVADGVGDEGAACQVSGR